MKFACILEDHTLGPAHPYGPLCHRWLPNGSADGISLSVEDPQATITVWFDRYGYADKGLIQFDYKKKEVPEELVRKQGLLDAGPLKGILKLDGVPQDQLEAMRVNRIGDEKYVQLGKRVAKKIIVPSVRHFITILRVAFGQYWIQMPEEWDSRKYSLGQYCSLYQMEASEDDGKTWVKFRPTANEVFLTSEVKENFPDYLTKEGWAQLAALCSTNWQPSLGASLLLQAHKLYDQGNSKYAVIEAASALEVIIGEVVKRNLRGSARLIEAVQDFYQLSLKAQLGILTTAIPQLSTAE